MMPRFFVSDIGAGFIEGEDARHIARSLRMRRGEPLTLCDGQGTDFHCEITDILSDRVYYEVLRQEKSISEPSVAVTLFQCLPKGDKMDGIIKKSVELGVYSIVPVISERCVSTPSGAALERKRERWQKIALEAAKQSGRGIVPQIERIVPFADAVKKFCALDTSVFFYEGGGESLKGILSEAEKRSAGGTLGIFIGTEGGFSEQEVKEAYGGGARVATLGPRILRVETAPICVLSVVMYALGELEGRSEG